MTMALKCLVFEKIAFLYFGDRQADRRTDGQTRCMKPLSLSRAAAYSVVYDLMRRICCGVFRVQTRPSVNSTLTNTEKFIVILLHFFETRVRTSPI